MVKGSNKPANFKSPSLYFLILKKGCNHIAADLLTTILLVVPTRVHPLNQWALHKCCLTTQKVIQWVYSGWGLQQDFSHFTHLITVSKCRFTYYGLHTMNSQGVQPYNFAIYMLPTCFWHTVILTGTPGHVRCSRSDLALPHTWTLYVSMANQESEPKPCVSQSNTVIYYTTLILFRCLAAFWTVANPFVSFQAFPFKATSGHPNLLLTAPHRNKSAAQLCRPLLL